MIIIIAINIPDIMLWFDLCNVLSSESLLLKLGWTKAKRWWVWRWMVRGSYDGGGISS